MNDHPTDLTPGELILVWDHEDEKFLLQFHSYDPSETLVNTHNPEYAPLTTRWLHWSRPDDVAAEKLNVDDIILVWGNKRSNDRYLRRFASFNEDGSINAFADGYDSTYKHADNMQITWNYWSKP